jgi:HD-like signal output (HDOD) protein
MRCGDHIMSTLPQSTRPSDVRNLFATRGARLRLEDIVAETDHLRPLCTSYIRLADLLADEDADLRDIVEVIAYDPILTASMLRTANSASSPPTRPVATVHDAVIRLGTGRVLSVALSAFAACRVHTSTNAFTHLEGEMWRHSVTAALAAETLAGWSRLAVPAGAPAAALLHDVGKLVLAQAVSPHMLQLIGRTASSEGRSLTDVETEVIGIDHGQVGGLVALHWRLPPAIAEAIVNHHVACSHTGPLAHVVYLAQAVSADLERPDAVADISRERVDAIPMLALGIEPERYRDLLVSTQQRYALLSARFC